MRVKAGEYEKEIPKEYADAVKLLTLSDWEEPNKIRLTPYERLMFAEAAWRVGQPKIIAEYIGNRRPEKVIMQSNRKGDTRNVVRYGEIDGVKVQAIIPTWVMRACPPNLLSHEYENWKL